MRRIFFVVLWTLYLSLITAGWPVAGRVESPAAVASTLTVIAQPDTPSDVPWGG